MKNRENNFGMIRLAAAFMVLSGHMYELLGQQAPDFLWHPIHRTGVAVFFSIGGYLITKSWLAHPDFAGYLIKRSCRIFPSLAVNVLVTVFLVGAFVTALPLRMYFTSAQTWKYLANMCLFINHHLPGVFTMHPYPNAVNGSLWTLPVEFVMYLLIPLWICIGKRFSRQPYVFWTGSAAAVLLLGSVCGMQNLAGGGILDMTIFGRQFGAVVQPILTMVPYEVAGSLVAICHLERFLSLQRSALFLLLVPGIGVIPEFMSGLAGYLFVPYVTLSFALAEKPCFAKISRLDISYGIYLYGFVIQQLLIHICLQKDLPLDRNLLFILALLLSVLAGCINERLIERPVAVWTKALNRPREG